MMDTYFPGRVPGLQELAGASLSCFLYFLVCYIGKLEKRKQKLGRNQQALIMAEGQGSPYHRASRLSPWLLPQGHWKDGC